MIIVSSPIGPIDQKRVAIEENQEERIQKDDSISKISETSLEAAEKYIRKLIESQILRYL